MCPHSAVQMFGENVTVDDLMKEIKKDDVFYRRSGGGVTLTGGEPLLQPEFAKQLIDACYLEGIHTAMETTALVPLDVIRKTTEHLDLFLIDVKSLVPEQYDYIFGREVKGQEWIDMLKENLKGLSADGKSIIIRCPIIPRSFNSGFTQLLGQPPTAILNLCGRVNE